MQPESSATSDDCASEPPKTPTRGFARRICSQNLRAKLASAWRRVANLARGWRTSPGGGEPRQGASEPSPRAWRDRGGCPASAAPAALATDLVGVLLESQCGNRRLPEPGRSDRVAR